jgi:hypothetical protein
MFDIFIGCTYPFSKEIQKSVIYKRHAQFTFRSAEAKLSHQICCPIKMNNFNDFQKEVYFKIKVYLNFHVLADDTLELSSRSDFDNE